MKLSQIFPVLAALLLTAENGTAQTFQAKKLNSQQFSKVERKGRPSRIQFDLIARDHQLLATQDGSGSIVVREDTTGLSNRSGLSSQRAGLPSLSLRQVKVILPYQASFEDLRVEILSEATESLGFFEVGPAEVAKSLQEDAQGVLSVEEHAPDGLQLDDIGRDTGIYSSNTEFPAESVTLTGTGTHRALRYARIAYCPFRWNPVTKELTKVTSVKVRLWWMPRPPVSSEKRELELGDGALEEVIEDALHPDWCLVVDGKILSSYDFDRRTSDWEYLIITSEQVLAGCHDSLHAFINMKTAQGYTVKLVSVEVIEANYHISISRTSRRAESIRAFLKDNYLLHGIEHVLLIGDPDPDDQRYPSDSIGDVPMLMTWPQGYEEGALGVPNFAYTDLYYADLDDPKPYIMAQFKPRSWAPGSGYDGTWDLDGDGFPGECKPGHDMAAYHTPDSSKETHHFVADLVLEVNVARIPFGDVERVSDHLIAQVEYQTAPMTGALRNVRRTVMLAMAECSPQTTMASLGRKMKSEFLPDAGFNTFELYQTAPYDGLLGDGLAPDIMNLTGAGLVICAGPGHTTGIKANPAWFLPFSWDFGFSYMFSLIHVDDAERINTSLTRSMFIGLSPFNSFDETYALVPNLMEHACVGAFGNTGQMFFDNSREMNWGEGKLSDDLAFLAAECLQAGDTIGDAFASAIERNTDVTDLVGPDGITSVEAHSVLSFNAYGDPTGRYITD